MLTTFMDRADLYLQQDSYLVLGRVRRVPSAFPRNLYKAGQSKRHGDVVVVLACGV